MALTAARAENRAKIKSMAAVFFIIRRHRSHFFWALWQSLDAFENGLGPRDYGVADSSYQELLSKIVFKHPVSFQIHVVSDEGEAHYRRIKRSELPHEVQVRIEKALKQRRQERYAEALSVGFLATDLDSLAAFKRRYRELAIKKHPDHGGDRNAFLHLQEVYQRMRLMFLA